ncbi:DUF6177 family protein [Streptomyces sp. NPDC057074]|uniref:DUF6177 family protein n=1 Tax=Streptomyces sp. NPDC057074 TaxID=3346015 RepID=UPI00362F61F7
MPRWQGSPSGWSRGEAELASLRAARRDLTVSARLEGPPSPVTFTLGRAEGERLGHTAEAARHYRLGDGTDAVAWARFRDLIVRLGLRGEASREAGRAP